MLYCNHLHITNNIPNSYPKWLTANLQHQLKCIHTLSGSRRYRNSPTDHVKNHLELHEIQFTHECSLSKMHMSFDIKFHLRKI